MRGKAGPTVRDVDRAPAGGTPRGGGGLVFPASHSRLPLPSSERCTELGVDRASWRLRLALNPRLPRLPRLAPVGALRTSPSHPPASLHHRLRPARRRGPPRPLLRLRQGPGGAAGALRSWCLLLLPTWG